MDPTKIESSSITLKKTKIKIPKKLVSQKQRKNIENMIK